MMTTTTSPSKPRIMKIFVRECGWLWWKTYEVYIIDEVLELVQVPSGNEYKKKIEHHRYLGQYDDFHSAFNFAREYAKICGYVFEYVEG